MKKMKRVLAFVFAMILTIAMSVPVFATESGSSTKTYSLEITGANEGHTFTAYQIFSGKLNAAKNTLSDVAWGEGVTAAAKAALGDPEAYIEAHLTTDADAEAEAKVFTENNYLASASGSTSTCVDGTYTISGLAAGYYLIIDVEGDNEITDTYSAYIMQLTNDVTATAKNGTTTSWKKIKDTNDTTGEVSDWQDSADYDIGDDIDFQLTGVVGSDYANYDTYYFELQDDACEALTFKQDTVKVYVDGTQITSGYTLTPNANGNDFNVTFADLKALTGVTVNAGSVITVEYKSTLNEKAKIGSEGNPNLSRLIYSNNPNSDGTGSTEWDKVIAFTYKVVVNKVTPVKNDNGETVNEPLPGAEFTLTKTVKDGDTTKEVTVAVVKNDAGTVFSFKGLDDGNYTLTETTTPDGYNSIDPITFTVTATHDITSDDPRLTGLTGDVTSGAITLTQDKTEGAEDALTADVVNKTGSILPHTGGAGRIALYVVGGVIVIAVGVILVTLLRTKKNA